MDILGDSGHHTLALSPGILDLLSAPCPTSSRASHLGHFPHSSRVSSDFPLQTCLGLGLKMPTQSAHHQWLRSLPSLDIWDTQRGCCPFPFLQHTGVFLKRQDYNSEGVSEREGQGAPGLQVSKTWSSPALRSRLRGKEPKAFSSHSGLSWRWPGWPLGEAITARIPSVPCFCGKAQIGAGSTPLGP